MRLPGPGPRVLDHEAALILTRVAWVLSIADPWRTAPWCFEDLVAVLRWPSLPWMGPGERREHIWHDCDQPAGGATPFAGWTREQQGCACCHLDRIEYLTEYEWPSAKEEANPIEIDLGIGDYLADWPVVDGNHRLAAAALRGDEHLAVVVSGDWERAVRVLVRGEERVVS
jgi:hypothetical protein